MGARPSSEVRRVLSVDDLHVDELRQVLDRAGELKRNTVPAARPFVAALLFLAPSVRTRTGFAAAVGLLGGTPIDVGAMRSGEEMSKPEGFADTLRVLAGIADVVVCRTPFRLDPAMVARCAVTNFVNGGDGDGEHPSQALIDLWAMEQRGPIGELRVGICGDLGSRSVSSLLRLFDRMPPERLTLIAPPLRSETSVPIGRVLDARTTRSRAADFGGLDVVYMAGLPEGHGAAHADQTTRLAYALTEERLDSLEPDAVVLSPGPVIDEISPGAWADHRVRVMEQSDQGVFVRLGLLDLLLGVARTI